MFSWKIGGQKVVAVLDYDVIKSLLKVGDSKVGRVGGWGGWGGNCSNSLLQVGDSKVGGSA